MRSLPDLFPAEVGLIQVAIEDWEPHSTEFGIKLPLSLERAVEKRRAEFSIGRYCARLAFKALRPGITAPEIGIRPDRGPDWPKGIVGAITHCRGFAAAVLATEETFLGVGRDTEGLLDDSTAQEIRALVALPGETQMLAKCLGSDEYTALTLIFSAKESLYKCLAPRLGVFFDFSDARVESACLSSGTYVIRLVRSLNDEVPAGRSFTGDFYLSDGRVHTRCIWRRAASSAVPYR